MFIFFFLERTARVVSFPRHLMFYLSTKFDKTCTQMMAWHPTTPQYGLFKLIDTIVATTPPQSDQPNQPLSTVTLPVHDDHFEPMVGTLQG